MGAENHVTSCDLGTFVDQATEAVPAQNAHTSHVAVLRLHVLTQVSRRFTPPVA